MRRISTFAAGAGFGFVTLALFVQGVLPSLVPASRARDVSRAVRTETADVRWVRYRTPGYTPLERLGRAVYLREGCWYCHSQYVRPVAGEAERWGPVSEAGEYAWEQPHLLATRRIGPDLSRVGDKYGDDWHYAHHWDPRLTVPESIMPRFPWLYLDLTVPVRRDGDAVVLEPTAALGRVFTGAVGRPVRIVPDRSGLTFVPPQPDGQIPIDGTPVVDLTPLKGRPLEASALRLVVPTREMVGLVRYLQRLGASRGAWREAFPPQTATYREVSAAADSAGARARGERVYRRRCAGCHGISGDGAGPAATFLDPRPRDFTAGVFKFCTTPSGTLPVDADLLRTISRGVRGTAMPPWHELPEPDRVAVIAFIKTFSPRWKEEQPGPAEAIPAPPRGTEALVARGRDVYRTAKCWECHGDEGRGDGPSAGQLRDDFDLPIRPTDLARGRLKGGASVTDVYRTLTLGLDGTPMPSFADSIDPPDRWAVAYYVLSLSAWLDPLTGQPLALPPAARAALRSPSVAAGEPAAAWDPASRGRGAPSRHHRRMEE